MTKVVLGLALPGAGALVLALAAGIALGALFFGGLWLTVSSLRGRESAFLFLGSFTIRSAALLIGLWWIGKGDIVKLSVCCLGILVARTVAIRKLRIEGRAKVG